PHATPMTISIGTMDAMTKITQLPNVGKSNREITPREIAIIRTVATIPSAGCFMRPPTGEVSRATISHHLQNAMRGADATPSRSRRCAGCRGIRQTNRARSWPAPDPPLAPGDPPRGGDEAHAELRGRWQLLP